MQAKAEELKGPKRLSEFKVNPNIAASLGQLPAAAAPQARPASNGTIPAVHAPAAASPAGLLLQLDAPAAAAPAAAAPAPSGTLPACYFPSPDLLIHFWTMDTVPHVWRSSRGCDGTHDYDINISSLQEVKTSGTLLREARAPSPLRAMIGCPALAPAATGLEELLRTPQTPLVSCQALLMQRLPPAMLRYVPLSTYVRRKWSADLCP